MLVFVVLALHVRQFFGRSSNESLPDHCHERFVIHGFSVLCDLGVHRTPLEWQKDIELNVNFLCISRIKSVTYNSF